MLQRRREHSPRRPHRLISSPNAPPRTPPTSSRYHHHHQQQQQPSRHHHHQSSRHNHQQQQQQARRNRRHNRFTRVPSDLSLTTITEESETSSIATGTNDQIAPSILVRPTSVVVVKSQADQDELYPGHTSSHAPSHASSRHSQPPLDDREYHTPSRHHQAPGHRYTLDKSDKQNQRGYVATVKSTTRVTVKIRTSLPGFYTFTFNLHSIYTIYILFIFNLWIDYLAYTLRFSFINSLYTS